MQGVRIIDNKSGKMKTGPGGDGAAHGDDSPKQMSYRRYKDTIAGDDDDVEDDGED